MRSTPNPQSKFPVQDLEEKVLHHQADTNVRLEFLESNLKNLAYNIQGFAPTKEEEADLEASHKKKVHEHKQRAKAQSSR